jgi:drug/metabolite transporter (DMT)-like permease
VAVPRIRAVAPFLLFASLSGFSFPAISIGLEALLPVLFTAFRDDVAAVLLLGAASVRSPGREWLPTLQADRFAVFAAGVFLIAGVVLLDEYVAPVSLVGFAVIFLGSVMLKRRAIAALLDV